MKLGTNVSGTNDGIFVNNNNFLFTDGQFKTGNATNFISHDGSGDVHIASQIFELKGGLEHREIFRPVILEMMRRFLWTSSVIGYQETILPNKDFITELLICNKNNLKRTRRISM